MEIKCVMFFEIMAKFEVFNTEITLIIIVFKELHIYIEIFNYVKSSLDVIILIFVIFLQICNIGINFLSVFSACVLQKGNIKIPLFILTLLNLRVFLNSF